MSNLMRTHRYQHVCDVLKNEIERGIFAIGDRIPSEQKLCGRFDVSRFTVREALKQLILLGMVARRQGSGTVVIASEPNTGYVQKVASLEELVRYGPETIFKVDDDWPVTARNPPTVILPDTSGWHVIRGRRLEKQGRLICAVDIYVQDRFAQLAETMRHTNETVFETLERQFGVSAHDIRVDITSMTADPDRAKVLGLPVGSPVLRVIRSYRDIDGNVFEVSIADHPADRFSVSFNFSRET